MNPKPLSSEIVSIVPASIDQASRKKKNHQVESDESRDRRAAAGGRHIPIAVPSTAGRHGSHFRGVRAAHRDLSPFWQAAGNLIRDSQSPFPGPGLQPARSEPRPQVAEDKTATRKEFDECARLTTGRFASEIKLIHDWPGHKKKHGDVNAGIRMVSKVADRSAFIVTYAAATGIGKESMWWGGGTPR